MTNQIAPRDPHEKESLWPVKFVHQTTGGMPVLSMTPKYFPLYTKADDLLLTNRHPARETLFSVDIATPCPSYKNSKTKVNKTKRIRVRPTWLTSGLLLMLSKLIAWFTCPCQTCFWSPRWAASLSFEYEMEFLKIKTYTLSTTFNRHPWPWIHPLLVAQGEVCSVLPSG